MKKILFIDPLSPEGHIQYNKYWLKALEKLNYEYDVLFKEGYKKKLGLLKNTSEIPSNLYKKIDKTNNFIIKRYYLFKILKYIHKTNDFKKYDYIVYSSFENFSMVFYLFFLKKQYNIFAILHNNLEKIGNKYIVFIIRFISKKLNLISLDQNIQKKLKEKKIDTKLVIHPIPIPFFEKNIAKDDSIYVYSPSKSSVDEEFILNLLKNKEYFKNNKIKFFIRSSKYEYEDEKIKISGKILSKNEYEENFLKADIILLPYKTSFQNRVSNVFFEAISNQKKIGVLKGSFVENYIDKNIFKFKDIKELRKEILKIKKKDTVEYKVFKEKFSQNIMRKQIENLFGEVDGKL